MLDNDSNLYFLFQLDQEQEGSQEDDEGEEKEISDRESAASPQGPTPLLTDLYVEPLSSFTPTTSKDKGRKGDGKHKAVVMNKMSSALLEQTRASTEVFKDKVVEMLHQANARPPQTPAAPFGQYLAFVSADLHPSLQSDWRHEVIKWF